MADDSGSDDADGCADDDAAPSAAPAAAGAARAAAKQPGSRLAARRQQRGKLRAPGPPRVPAALVPDDLDDEGDDDDGDDGDDGTDDDPDYTFDRAAYVSVASEEEDEQQQQQQQQQLPRSVLQQAQGPRGQQRQRQQQQQLRGQPGTAATAAGAAADPSNQQQQRGGSGGGRPGGSRPGGSSSEGSQQQRQQSEPLELSEASPMYLPVLTDEDLAADPPGHKSGYVAVIGRPNAGKSTLINAVVGQKLSIVTFKPQTTRHRVVGIASDTDYQMILFDTPGIMQEQRSKLDERMMAAVVSSIKAAEVIIAVVDANDEPQQALSMFQPGPDWNGPPMAVLLNKADLLAEEAVAELKEWYAANCRAEQVFVGTALSADDAGVQAIKAWAVQKLPEGPTLYPKSMVSEQPERFFVSEIIREQIFLQYEQEIPYACQVQIADFKERRGAKDYIEAVILVERESQAPIVLGRGGACIKKLGSAARQQIEEFLGRKVFLQLSVQVAPSWRQQPDKLKDFGYFDALYVS